MAGELSPEVQALNAALPGVWEKLQLDVAPCARCGVILPTKGRGMASLIMILGAVQNSAAAVAAALKAARSYFGEEGPVEFPSNMVLAASAVLEAVRLHQCARCQGYLCKRCVKEPHEEGACALCSKAGAAPAAADDPPAEEGQTLVLPPAPAEAPPTREPATAPLPPPQLADKEPEPPPAISATATSGRPAGKQRYPVGIDLGTTFSSLAYVDEQGRVQALRLPEGGFTVASAVYFKGPNEIIVGTEALNYSVLDASRVARAFKRRMGDPSFHFEVDGKSFRPEELSAMILKKLLDAGREQLGPIEEAVISVPFVFDEARRRATQHAGTIAGLNKIDLVDEPVAAALAYGHHAIRGGGFFGSEELNKLYADQNVLVYDLGGGTFDATVMNLSGDGVFEVLATGGDERLGGEDWDNALVELIAERYEKETAANPRGDKELMQEFRLKAVEAKKSLSERPRAEFVLERDGKRVSVVLAVGEFERRTEPLLVRTQDTIEDMLKRKRLSWGHIDRVLMVGGSSRMPMVGKMLDRVTGRRLDRSLPPDIAIAEGAAIFAAHRSGRGGKLKKIITVNSHPLGLKVRDPVSGRPVNDILLKANEPTLTRVARPYRVQQTARRLLLDILLGDDPDPAGCVFLGRGQISDLPAGLTGSETVEVTFCFQANGLLQVQGRIPRPGGKPLAVHFDVAVEGKMSEEEVSRARHDLSFVEIV